MPCPGVRMTHSAKPKTHVQREYFMDHMKNGMKAPKTNRGTKFKNKTKSKRGHSIARGHKRTGFAGKNGRLGNIRPLLVWGTIFLSGVLVLALWPAGIDLLKSIYDSAGIFMLIPFVFFGLLLYVIVDSLFLTIGFGGKGGGSVGSRVGDAESDGGGGCESGGGDGGGC